MKKPKKDSKSTRLKEEPKAVKPKTDPAPPEEVKPGKMKVLDVSILKNSEVDAIISKLLNPQASKNKRAKKKFFLINGTDILVVESNYFDTISSREQAFNIGLNLYIEINRFMLEDSVDELGEAKIGKISVVNGLNRSLKELDKRFPAILTQIHFLDLKIDGNTLFKC